MRAIQNGLRAGRAETGWDDAKMHDGVLVARVASVLAGLDADGVAIGAAGGDVSKIAWRGRYADTQVDSQSVFYGASVTKQMVGILLARAVVDGAIDVDDAISRWLPELSDQTGSVRIHHLIHHTSGLPDVADPGDGVPSSNAEIIERFRRLTASAPDAPGTRYSYNNAGYALLAEALSRSLNRPIEDVASTTLFSPLKVTQTRLGGPPVQLPGSPNPPGTVGDGGLWVSIHDLLRWLQACNAEAFGADVHRLAEMTTHLIDGSPVDYAWGVHITPTPHGRVISHGGRWSKWVAKTVRIPERHIAVAILSVGATMDSISEAAALLAATIASR